MVGFMSWYFEWLSANVYYLHQDILLSLAKAVANTTAALVLKAKNVAAQCRDEQSLQNAIIAAATNCALATSQLVACAKVRTTTE